MTKQIYTIDEAAEYLGVHHTTVRRHIKAGTYPNATKGRKGIITKVWLIPKSDLDNPKLN